MRRSTRNAAILLLPAVVMLGGVFAGGLILAVVQSVGFFSAMGENHFTMRHYGALLSDAELRVSLGLTILLATTATAISGVAGLGLALVMRNLVGGSRVLGTLMQVPIAIPHLAIAVVVINVLSQSGLVARLMYLAGLVSTPADFPELLNDRYGRGILMAYVLKETPFVALVTLAMLRRTAPEYEALAATLGASPWQQFRHVTLPLVAPSVISSSLLAFAFVFGAFEVPYLLGRPYPAMLGVVAQRRFFSIDLADRPDAIAVAVTMSVVSALLVFLYLHMGRKLIGERPVLF